MSTHRLAAACALAVIAAGPARAGTEQVIHDFLGAPSDGTEPLGGLVAVGGMLYGTTNLGGSSGQGTVYAIGAQGAERVLHSFAGGADGRFPAAGLTHIGGDRLDGVTAFGGAQDDGVAFTTTTSGTLTVVTSFTQRTGTHPAGRLLRLGGAEYGLAEEGGAGGPRTTCGALYKLGGNGGLRAVHTFRCRDDGRYPEGDLLLMNGVFYGAAALGGSGYGIIVAITPAGQEAVLHTFQRSDGYGPNGDLVDVDGALYGTTGSGGEVDVGTVFRLAADGTFTLLHSFGGTNDGQGGPRGGLVDVGGTLYGVTQNGGAAGLGSIFTVTPGPDTVSVVYSFPSGGTLHGAHPSAGLTELNGALYGTTFAGGANDMGTVFRYRP